jgi:NAD(P)-dependent dehydrogenase (short-subunit alcohol dehydrogenase family)
MTMKLDNKTLFVTGSNRGIGKAIVDVLLKHPVRKIYAAARQLEGLPPFNDNRVVPIKLDIGDPEQIQQAVALAEDVEVLINNAGVMSFAGAVLGESDLLKQDMEVNYFGTLNLSRSFIPVLEKQEESAIVNLLSVLSLASMAGIAGYCASKAALFSATQAMRTELKAKNISVRGVFPGPIDTDMAKGLAFPKTSVQITAENIVAGILAGQEDIFPDTYSVQVSELWAKDPKALERQFAAS